MADAPAEDLHSGSAEAVLEQALQGGLQPDAVLAWLHATAEVRSRQLLLPSTQCLFLTPAFLCLCKKPG
jgi:hypothetical protein